MGLDDICNTSLVLGLGLTSMVESTTKKPNNMQESVVTTAFEPSLSLGLCKEPYDYDHDHDDGKIVDKLLYRQESAASSFCNTSNTNNNIIVIKRERVEVVGSEEVDIERFCSRVSDEDDDGITNSTTRKKLRLNKDQSVVLEESFKQHSTLNPKQKQELARKLNLRPRQVEVWFQNRRARTKLKQTEVDLEFLKKCCETLKDENRRLQKELQELKALKLAQQPALYIHNMPAATLMTMCPSCDGSNDNNKTSRTKIVPKTTHFLFDPFTNPSTAC